MTDQEEEQNQENIETEEGREYGVDNGELDPREAAFLEGYESDEKDANEDYGLDDDEKLDEQ